MATDTDTAARKPWREAGLRYILEPTCDEISRFTTPDAWRRPRLSGQAHETGRGFDEKCRIDSRSAAEVSLSVP